MVTVSLEQTVPHTFCTALLAHPSTPNIAHNILTHTAVELLCFHLCLSRGKLNLATPLEHKQMTHRHSQRSTFVVTISFTPPGENLISPHTLTYMHERLIQCNVHLVSPQFHWCASSRPHSLSQTHNNITCKGSLC